MNPKVSVIVPVYNTGAILRGTLDSIINQTYKDFELILVDDGSKDESPKICDEYASKDLRIKVIHKANGGICDARNVGIAAAAGEYIISYGNLLTKLGLLGGIVYLAFAISLIIFLFKKRKENIYILIGAAQMIVAFLNSFAGTTLSDASNFCMIFLMLSTIYTYKKSANNNISLNTTVVKS